MKVYLAARFEEIRRIRAFAEELRGLGIDVTSHWVEEPYDPKSDLDDPHYTEKILRDISERDIRDIDAADTFVLFTISPRTKFKRGGRHFETGYAWSKGKSIILVGPYENSFHYLPGITRVTSWKALKQLLLTGDGLMP